MRQTLSIVLLAFLFSCGHHYELNKEVTEQYYKRVTQKSDTLIVAHDNCTGCGDFIIDQGTIHVPVDLVTSAGTASLKDFNICGNFPTDILKQPAGPDGRVAYRITGKVIKVDARNSATPKLLFYIDDWDKFYFDKSGWLAKNDKNSYTERSKMIGGVNEYFLFERQPVAALTTLLGAPDEAGKNKVTYQIDDQQNNTASSRLLIITYDQDSIINSRRIVGARNSR